MSLNFFIEISNFKLSHKILIRHWIKNIIHSNNKKVGDINFIFVSINFITETNIKYLKHYYATDIITFNYNNDNIISGDIFICPEIVNQNQNKYYSKSNDELHRVIIHGILHLIGFNDSNEQEVLLMRSKENDALTILNASLIHNS